MAVNTARTRPSSHGPSAKPTDHRDGDGAHSLGTSYGPRVGEVEHAGARLFEKPRFLDEPLFHLRVPDGPAISASLGSALPSSTAFDSGGFS